MTSTLTSPKLRCERFFSLARVKLRFTITKAHSVILSLTSALLSVAEASQRRLLPDASASLCVLPERAPCASPPAEKRATCSETALRSRALFLRKRAQVVWSPFLCALCAPPVATRRLRHPRPAPLNRNAPGRSAPPGKRCALPCPPPSRRAAGGSSPK